MRRLFLIRLMMSNDGLINILITKTVGGFIPPTVFVFFRLDGIEGLVSIIFFLVSKLIPQ